MAQKKTGKTEQDRGHYLQRKFKAVVGEKGNGEALSFIVAACVFLVIATWIDDPMARRRLSPEYRVLNNHLFDMQTDFSTALLVHLRKGHQHSSKTQRKKRLLTRDEYN